MRVNGFELEVALEDGLPHVRVSLADGTPVVDTTAVSITGLERLPEVFTAAARLAARQMDRYYDGVRREIATER